MEGGRCKDLDRLQRPERVEGGAWFWPGDWHNPKCALNYLVAVTFRSRCTRIGVAAEKGFVTFAYILCTVSLTTIMLSLL